MTKLKTLKDWENKYDEKDGVVDIKWLKAEAVKWIKRMSNYEALAWKKFFNITDEELAK